MKYTYIGLATLVTAKSQKCLLIYAHQQWKNNTILEMKTKLCRTKQNNHCLKSNWEQKDRTETIAKEYILKMEVEKMI